LLRVARKEVDGEARERSMKATDDWFNISPFAQLLNTLYWGCRNSTNFKAIVILLK
jgi:hypothetical protein